MEKQKIVPVHIMRRTVQIVSFLLLPGLFTSAFYAVKSVYMAIVGGDFSLTQMAPPILLLMSTILVTALMGRFFCGFVCSFGSMGDFLWFISKKTIKPRFKIGEKTDSALKLLKYGILLFIVFGIWTLNLIPFDSLSSPWTIFGMYATMGNWPSFKYLLSLGGFLLLLIIIGSLFIERFFCRYLCPLGAIFAINSKFRLFNIKKDREQCGSCRMCTNKCVMGIPLYKYDKVTSGECINCFNCTNHCPKNNAKASLNPLFTSLVALVAIFGLVYIGNVVSEATAQVMSQTASGTTLETTSNDTISNNNTNTQISAGSYKDGTYTDTGTGFRGETEVSVTVENGNISDIAILSYEDDREYFVRAEDSVISDIMESQDVNVDAVSGATFSSNGIMEAVANALGEAYTNTNDSTERSEHGGGHGGNKRP